MNNYWFSFLQNTILDNYPPTIGSSPPNDKICDPSLLHQRYKLILLSIYLLWSIWLAGNKIFLLNTFFPLKRSLIPVEYLSVSGYIPLFAIVLQYTGFGLGYGPIVFALQGRGKKNSLIYSEFQYYLPISYDASILRSFWYRAAPKRIIHNMYNILLLNIFSF